MHETVRCRSVLQVGRNELDPAAQPAQLASQPFRVVRLALQPKAIVVGTPEGQR